MATEIIMPQMGSDMKEGTVVRWIKSEGDSVARGEPLAEIETDKATVEVEAYASGVLRRVIVGEGVTVPVGQAIGIIAAADEELPEMLPMAAPPSAGPRRVARPPKAPAPTGEERIKASPMARKEAEARGIDLAQVPGTGPGGRVTREDVLKLASGTQSEAPQAPAPVAVPQAPSPPAQAPPPAAAPRAAPSAMADEVVALTRMRQAIALNMSRSKREIPHFYVTVDVDMTEAVQLREGLNQALEGAARVSINDMVIKATALTIQKHPVFNASYTEEGIQMHKSINIGVAVALEAGLIAPAILDCGGKGLVEIAQASHDLVERARSGVLTAQEYTSATLSVTNLGMYQVESFSAIITPPQSAALAVGTVRKQAVVRDGKVAEAEMMKLTLSIDHRVADGAQAAVFLGDLRSLLENPVSLLL